MQHIIACIDGSSYSQSVTALAAWAAQRIVCPLTLLHVLDDAKPEADIQLSGHIGLGSREHLLTQLAELDEQRAKIALKYGQVLLSDLEIFADKWDIAEVYKQQKHGNLVETLKEMADTTRVVVMGKSGELHQNDEKTLGSHLESVVRAIHSHILVSPSEFSQAPTSYVLAFDGSDISEKLVEKAINTPLLKGMTCHLVMVDDKQTPKEFKSASHRLQQQGVTVIEAHLMGNVVADSVLKYQQQHDIGLIAMGAYGHSKFRHWFVGSTTTKILTNATVPLLLIR
ncbi:universal stress protein [Vibrio palustris]|uniref:Universal stress protein family protein n=1 Tax=Vibrio palustris TaxID=1918946 RepID=A0A1R4B0J4_9VIBR|nr:universal stress protein [Vibrio palustris]SJL82445.1 Universal stress protein family protein [Vibrio palustris]